ncbi:vitellogenin-like [Sitophilus oryzae]|uniref:Vitellogenin-like n=1 Tax=Sitophilus oryzae TaxID=7048 RepID=A0A6J2XYL4_SITOR|nr:vitellogenin-like [Sitophilus oryzae]
MMWSPLVLTFLVGYTLASTPAFKENTEYVYQINGRTLSSLHDVSDQYSGIFLKAKFHISKQPDGKLQGRLSDAHYAQIHSPLPNGLETEIPESQMSYKKLSLSQNPFQMVVEDGLIQNIIMEKEVSNWEANIIKSITSQYQLDVNGKNAIYDPSNRLPSGDNLSGVFKTMEKTVTGETETEYKIHNLPLYILQSRPWLAPKSDIREDSEVFEVIKNKNYSNSEERPSYHYGFGNMFENEPTANSLGEFLTRQSESRAILTGKPSRYTIQSSYTVNKIVIKPSVNNKERGSVVSIVNATLVEIKNQNQQLEHLSNPVDIGDLVYTFEDPLSQNNHVREKSMKPSSSNEDVSEESNERLWHRLRRSISQKMEKYNKGSRSSEENVQQQQRPEMSHAPQSPLLPYLMGYHGKSIKQNRDFDLRQNVQRMAQEISENIQEPETILKQSTLSKYIMLASWVRVMDEEEIKHVAEQLYVQSGQGKELLAWELYRDAVAEAGTGPAFLNIQRWIENKKISNREAADVVSTMARSVRTPTDEYMQKFYDLTKSSKVKEQLYLNQTAVLSYANLVYRVYINRNESHNQYPVHSFGSFFTKEGRQFVKDIVIPYYGQQLEQAIAQADSPRVHLYITALGHIAHKKILNVYEPYLEGQKQCSQFQRMLMVNSLRRLSKTKPSDALPVLYRIFQNAGELPEIRIIAAYMVFKNPMVLSERLQSMAENTNAEYQEQVNAAIKSAIESASRMDSHKYHDLHKAAQSALPLLTKKLYGDEKSFIDFRDYIINDMHTEVYQDFLEIGGSESYWPKVVQLSAHGRESEMSRDYFSIGGMTSSIKEFTNVLYQQTDSYKQAKNQRSQHQSEESKWSSANIARYMNYQTEEREQLENYIYSDIAGVSHLWSFDNQTIERLPEVVREQEEILSKGKQISYTKLRQVQELALSVPTEMGLPFLYTYDTPILLRFEGKIQAKATPQVSDGKTLAKPDKIDAQIEGSVTFSAKGQSHLSFVTPFDHQVYTAGFDRNIQAHFPVNVKAEIDTKKAETTVEFKVKRPQNDARLLHYSSLPYTSRSDLMSAVPIILRPNTQIITPQVNKFRYFDTVYGKKETGMSFRAKGHYPVQTLNVGELVYALKSRRVDTLLQLLWDRSSLQNTDVSITSVPSQSTTNKVILRYSHRNEYKMQPDIENQEAFFSYDQLAEKSQGESQQRHEKLLKYVGAGIRSAQLHSSQLSLEFEGLKKQQYLFGVTSGKSNADPISRTIMYYKQNGEKQQQHQFSLDVKGYVPNTNGLDLTYSLKSAPEAKYEVRMLYGANKNDAALVSGKITFIRSDERKEMLTQKPLYNQCKREMQEGNFQLPACQNMTIESNLLDTIESQWQYSNINSNSNINNNKYEDIVKDVFETLKMYYYPVTRIERIGSKQNEIEVKIKLEPEDLRRLNISIESGEERTTMHDMPINSELIRTLLLSHPVFHAPSRYMGVLKAWPLFRPTCVIDQTSGQTFNNRTYPLSLGTEWTVALQYVPQEARKSDLKTETVEEQLKRQEENYAVLVRQPSAEEKEVLVTFNHPKSEGKTVEINMKAQQQSQRSGSSPLATVYVDSREMKFNDTEAADLYKGFVQIYALPNGEVKVEIQDAFYVIFDGKRVKLTSTSSKLRDSNKGLCGKFSNDKYEDFTVPANCIVADYNQFVESYQMTAGNERSQAKTQNCIAKVMPLYDDVIPSRNTNLNSEHSAGKVQLRNRYVEENERICFTIRPVPTCKGTPRKVLSKPVAVHCIEKTKTATYLKNQIDKGANPDFSHKEETKQVLISLAREC